MALSLSHFAAPRPRSIDAVRKNPSWIPFVRIWAQTELQAREQVQLLSEMFLKLKDSGFPIYRIVVAVWKGHHRSSIPGDKGFFIPLMRAELGKNKPPFEVELAEVETTDPYGSLLNLGAGFAMHRGGDYMLSVSPQAVDYLREDTACGFIEATMSGACGVGLAMSEVKEVVGPSNRLALWATGPLSIARGFATSMDRLKGTSGLLVRTAICQEQTGTLVQLGRHFGSCVRMVPASNRGLYRVPKTALGKDLHDEVAATVRDCQAGWLKQNDASWDELQSVLH